MGRSWQFVWEFTGWWMILLVPWTKVWRPCLGPQMFGRDEPHAQMKGTNKDELTGIDRDEGREWRKWNWKRLWLWMSRDECRKNIQNSWYCWRSFGHLQYIPSLYHPISTFGWLQTWSSICCMLSKSFFCHVCDVFRWHHLCPEVDVAAGDRSHPDSADISSISLAFHVWSVMWPVCLWLIFDWYLSDIGHHWSHHQSPDITRYKALSESLCCNVRSCQTDAFAGDGAHEPLTSGSVWLPFSEIRNVLPLIVLWIEMWRILWMLCSLHSEPIVSCVFLVSNGVQLLDHDFFATNRMRICKWITTLCGFMGSGSSLNSTPKIWMVHIKHYQMFDFLQIVVLTIVNPNPAKNQLCILGNLHEQPLHWMVFLDIYWSHFDRYMITCDYLHRTPAIHQTYSNMANKIQDLSLHGLPAWQTCPICLGPSRNGYMIGGSRINQSQKCFTLFHYSQNWLTICPEKSAVLGPHAHTFRLNPHFLWNCNWVGSIRFF